MSGWFVEYRTRFCHNDSEFNIAQKTLLNTMWHFTAVDRKVNCVPRMSVDMLPSFLACRLPVLALCYLLGWSVITHSCLWDTERHPRPFMPFYSAGLGWIGWAMCDQYTIIVSKASCNPCITLFLWGSAWHANTYQAQVLPTCIDSYNIDLWIPSIGV